MADAERFLLKSELLPGPFPEEYIATVIDHLGQHRTLIVPDDTVQGEAILVRLIDQGDGIALVRLPAQLLDAGWMLSVPQSHLEPA